MLEPQIQPTVPNFLEEEDYDEPIAAPIDIIPSVQEWKEAVATGEVKGYEHPSKGKNPDSKYKKKRKPGTKYHRRDITETDFFCLAFTQKFRLVTTKQIAILLGITRSGASRRMNGLKEIGFVAQERTPGMPVLWYVKPKGKVALSNANHVDDKVGAAHKAGVIKFGTLQHAVYSAQIAAQLAAGLPILPNSAMMSHLPTGRELLPCIIDETFLRKSWGRATYEKVSGSKGQTDRGVKIQRDAKAAIEAGRLSWSEVLEENPSMWTISLPLMYRNEAKEFHYPDMVINFEHLRTAASPASVAVEIELSMKAPKDLKAILNTFKMSMMHAPIKVYRQVIYVVQSDAVAEAVKKTAGELGFTPAQLKVVRVKDLDNNIFKGNVWEL